MHELSGDDTAENMRTSLEPELPQESDMEFNDRTQEDVLERLAYAEQLVVELKEIIRQKDAQLQQKDEVLQEERKAADNKIKTKTSRQGQINIFEQTHRRDEGTRRVSCICRISVRGATF